jgi:hypothetical protein
MKCDHGYPRKVFDNDSTHIVELNHHVREHGETYALRAFGIARGWNVMLRHCVFGFLGGGICTFCHIGINVWLSESTVVAAIVMPGIIVGFVPPVVVFLFYMDSRQCNDCAEEQNERYIYFIFASAEADISFRCKGILTHDSPPVQKYKIAYMTIVSMFLKRTHVLPLFSALVSTALANLASRSLSSVL